MKRAVWPALIATTMAWLVLHAGTLRGQSKQAASAPAPTTTTASTSAPSVWQKLHLPDAAANANLNDVFFFDDKNGWIVGNGGLCLSTTDAGRTWQAVETKSAATLRKVRFLDAKTGWIVGDGDPAAPAARGHVLLGGPPPKSGTLLSTTDGGQTWQTAWVPTNFQITSAATADGKRLQLGNSGGPNHPDGDILVSTDGGKSFRSQRAYRTLMDVIAIDAKNWVAVGAPVLVGFFPKPTEELYTRSAARAIYSTDGGTTWNVADGSDDRGVILRALAWREGQPLVAVGAKSTVLLSSDKGVKWTKLESIPTREILRSVAWGTGAKPLAVAVGDKGAAIVSSDGGQTWSASPTGITENLAAVWVVGRSFTAVGENGAAITATGRNSEGEWPSRMLDYLKYLEENEALRPLPPKRGETRGLRREGSVPTSTAAGARANQSRYAAGRSASNTE